ncbi:Hypothetical predicted protein [Lecanosticta acicola]|uniref:PIN domain-containing protein n=1 Tax=Lecanosticta acicola TaxID=111012 RepID=A0AAI9ECU3_9PEZI|nr:Hypothetical predicted protein [Lecanosticta acicola]
MRTRQRPTSRHAAPPQILPPTSRPIRKVFNCIVDDSALVAGVKKSTRNGIRQWVKNEQVRLFVPLHALDELSRQKSGKNKHADDVRETLSWLDEATTKHPDVVTLQGADETYERWAEVERFVVPRTLFSEYDHELEPEAGGNVEADSAERPTLTEGILKDTFSSVASEMSGSLSPRSLKSVRSSVSLVSPPTSPPKTTLSSFRNISSVATLGSRPQSTTATVPTRLQPLFNYILWRIHQETDPVAALESFIFLCNDPGKVHCAKGFDIKTKRLEQLREAVGREDRDYKNRMALLDRENQNIDSAPRDQLEAQEQTKEDVDDDEDEVEDGDEDGDEEKVVFTPPRAPAAMLHKQQTNVIDPNAFSRRPQPVTAPKGDHAGIGPKSPRLHQAPPSRGSPRGTHAIPFAPRGALKGNANGRGAGRGGPRGRGNFASPRGGIPHGAADQAGPTSQIDPDSFARPNPRSGASGSRGARKLWVPT